MGFVGIGVASIGFIGMKTLFPNQGEEGMIELESVEYNASPWKLEVLKRLPFSITSRIWGSCSRIQIPESMREPIYRLYGNAFSVKFDECELPLRDYPSLSHFFARRLKPGSRPIDKDESHMVSPVDGKVIYFGLVQKDSMEQVKGISYSLERFLGPVPSSPSLETQVFESGGKIEVRMPDDKTQAAAGSMTETPQQVALEVTVEAIKELDDKPDHIPRKLYHIGLYLAPGDYHGYHSPTDWTISSRRHFPGYLFPVAPVVVRSIQGLFHLNERVIVTGKWKHGFFAFAPVGASNVGSIKLSFDPHLATNRKGRMAEDGSVYHDHDVDFLATTGNKGLVLRRGDEIGFFHMGSTVVLIFEVPMDHEFVFTVKPGQKVVLGKSIGYLSKKSTG